jgi:hypothetical protein
MRNAEEILNDAFRVLAEECEDMDVFVKTLKITRDDIHDGKPIIGIHYGGSLVQYWVCENDIDRLGRLCNEYK